MMTSSNGNIFRVTGHLWAKWYLCRGKWLHTAHLWDVLSTYPCPNIIANLVNSISMSLSQHQFVLSEPINPCTNARSTIMIQFPFYGFYTAAIDRMSYKPFLPILHSYYCGGWRTGNTRSPGIGKCGVDVIFQEYVIFSTGMVDNKQCPTIDIDSTAPKTLLHKFGIKQGRITLLCFRSNMHMLLIASHIAVNLITHLAVCSG